MIADHPHLAAVDKEAVVDSKEELEETLAPRLLSPREAARCSSVDSPKM